MKKLIFAIICCAGSNIAYAQNEILNECNTAPGRFMPKLEVVVNDLKVDTTYTSKELLTLKKIKSVAPGDTVLGLFHPKTVVGINPESYTVLLNNKPICTRIKSAVIRYELTPTIYIAKEAMQLSCTKQRVYKHELIHYNIELSAINRLKEIVNTVVAENLYKINFIDPNNRGLSVSIVKAEMDRVGNFVDSITGPENDLMDSPENYKAESNLCPAESVALNDALLKTKGLPITQRPQSYESPHMGQNREDSYYEGNTSQGQGRVARPQPNTSNNGNYQQSYQQQPSYEAPAPSGPGNLFR